MRGRSSRSVRIQLPEAPGALPRVNPAKAYSRYANAAQPGRVDALEVIAFASTILPAASAFSRVYSRTLQPAQVESDFSFISFRPGRPNISAWAMRMKSCGAIKDGQAYCQFQNHGSSCRFTEAYQTALDLRLIHRDCLLLFVIAGNPSPSGGQAGAVG